MDIVDVCIDKKYFFFSLWEDIGFGDSNKIPKFYSDWYKYRADLEREYRSNSGFVFYFGIFGKRITIEFKWGHVERPKNEEEIELEEKILKLINEWGEDE